MATEGPYKPHGSMTGVSLPHDPAVQAVSTSPDAVFTSGSRLTIARPGRLTALGIRFSDRVETARHALAAEWLYEREAGGLFNAMPVCLALGILGYFLAIAEPVPGLLPVSALVPALLAMRLRHHGMAHAVLVATALVFAGASLAQWRTLRTGDPVLVTSVKAVITGTVIETDANSRGSPRYLIRPVSIEGLAPSQIPHLVRLSASSKAERFNPGEGITGLASLQPVSGPAFPGSYHFGFFARYDGMGGAGFFMGAPKSVQATGNLGLVEKVQVKINRLRMAIAARIIAALPDEEGTIATALITGDRSRIPEKIQDSLRQSGLAHVLAISGLHMALVTLTVVGFTRYVLAYFPSLALHYPIRKWAAGAGLAAATLYLMISGASVATQRAWFMIAIMLAATLVDRRGLTIRNVALAAAIILCLTPEALLEPGFQMSFAAAAALVSAYEAVTEFRNRRFGEHGRETPGYLTGFLRSGVSQISSLAFTSIVAGLATGIFAAWHFHRVAPMGFVANLAAMPIVSFLVMPLALVSSLLMPYGLEFVTLDALGWSIRRMVEISDWTNSHGVSGITGAKPMAFLLLGSAGICCLTLLRSKLRLLGLASLLALPLTFANGPPPDILVSQDGRAVAFAAKSGKLALAYPRRNTFVSDIWLNAFSGGEAETDRAMFVECNKDHCLARLPNGLSVDIVYSPKYLTKACGSADILIAPRLRWVNCKGRAPLIVLKRHDFESHGTHELTLPRQPVPTPSTPLHEKQQWLDTVVIKTAMTSGNRPWQKPAMTDPDAEQKATVSSAGSSRRVAPEPSPDPE
ncbi:MAG: ComEC/Rec2 family competence protein [Nitratireductor sp.]